MALLNPDFPLECQLQFNWCWAAVTNAVHQHPVPAAILNQCQMASKVLGHGADCCSDPDPCDVTFSLRSALDTIGRLDLFLTGQVTFDVIENEINIRRRPVCARIVWDTDRDGWADGAHFVAIVGCGRLSGVPWVWVKDPDGGYAGMAGPVEAATTDMAFATFRNRYRLVGSWSHTYLVD